MLQIDLDAFHRVEVTAWIWMHFSKLNTILYIKPGERSSANKYAACGTHLSDVVPVCGIAI